MKKIMFNDRFGLTEAVLSGAKTQTRRIEEDVEFDFYLKNFPYKPIIESDAALIYDEEGTLLAEHKFRYKVGEVVAVAQSYEAICDSISIGESVERAKFYLKSIKSSYPNDYCFRDKNEGEFPAWTNKMFVKSELMPHQIRITNIRIERLKDISEDDCLKEGVRMLIATKAGRALGFDKAYEIAGGFAIYDTPREAFAALIDKVSGKGIWASNPFVWVYDLELIK